MLTPIPPMATSFLERIAPRLSMHMRGRKNRSNLFGLHAPAQRLVELVPKGRPAVDVGANRGLYAYWIGQAASRIDVFEPNPRHARLLRRSAQRNWIVHEVAASDRAGTAHLYVPDGLDGEAQLVSDKSMCVDGALLPVELRTIDSFAFQDLGFLKIDVEGHELAVLAGAEMTIRAHRPTIFIEMEERHRHGAVSTGTRMIWDLGYREGYFIRGGELLPIDDFELERDQMLLADQPSSPRYVSNFVFKPG